MGCADVEPTPIDDQAFLALAHVTNAGEAVRQAALALIQNPFDRTRQTELTHAMHHTNTPTVQQARQTLTDTPRRHLRVVGGTA